MKRFLRSLLLTVILINSTYSTAQQPQLTDSEITAIALQRGIAEIDIPGFITHYRKYHLPHNSQIQRNPSATPTAPLTTFNLGFETGDFSGWTGYIGNNDIQSDSIWSNVQYGIFSTTNNATINSCNARHTIFDTITTDYCGNFQILPPAMGTAIARLNNNCAGYMGSGIQKSWTVTPGSSVLYISYALLLNDGGHTVLEAPYFSYQISDSITGSVLFDSLIMANQNTTPPFIQCPTDPYTSYLNWRTDTIDLTSWLNQTIIIKLEVAGCIYGAHFGIAYVNLDLPNPSAINTTSQNTLHLQPNPAINFAELTYPQVIDDDAYLILTDMSGRIINTDIMRTSAGWRINTSSLAAGIYTITVIAANEKLSTQRLLIQPH
ncbi:MAG: T9SS type A sorting domain-containing protein [Bacteroidetes bacterium]|nr:T9SS type A sorting domain-containing protein [Bacteroidota bacterium]